jgi:3-methyladenine DNA glycosylase AlkC
LSGWLFIFTSLILFMAEPLKNIYDDHFFKEFNQIAKKVIPSWEARAFDNTVKNKDWPQMELKQRMRHLSRSLFNALQGSYAKKLPQVLKMVQYIYSSEVRYSGLAYMFLADFVEQFGVDEMDRSFKAMEKINMITSCEFAIRPFLLANQDKVMEQMLQWSKHSHQNIRRFASEGCRPRLPWAMAIPRLKKDPSAILPILENLKADESVFVQKSVANNLNDISKDHPELVLALAKKWKGENKITDWILKHGCRGLLKAGHAATLDLFGTASNVKCALSNFKLSAEKVKLGGKLQFEFELEVKEKKSAALRIEYMVYFKKAGKTPSKKIFKINERVYAPGVVHKFSKTHSFADLTTRKHYKGEHGIAIIVNGKEMGRVLFELTG